jgi:hypothetical protein
MTTQALYDADTEKIIIGSILRQGEEYLGNAISAGLEPNHFHDEKQRIIFKACLELAAAGGPVDILSIKKTLEARSQLDQVGFKFLMDCVDGIPLNLDVKSYSEKLISLANKRIILSAAANLQTAAIHGNGDLPAAIEDIRRALDGYEAKASREQRGLTRKVTEYIEASEGSFSTNQVYADLGINDPKGRMAVRQALSRLNGDLIQPLGDKLGAWRKIRGAAAEMDLDNVETEELKIWLPFDLHNYVSVLPGNIIVVTGDPDSGKTALLLDIIRRNIQSWDCHYLNSEMGSIELRKRLDLFGNFPVKNRHFHAYERSGDFADVIQSGKYSLNVIDYLEVTDEFYLIGKHINDIHRALGDAVAIIAIQKKSRTCDLPLGAQRALEKPRLAISLSAGSKSEPNRVTILKCKNRKVEHSLIGKSRTYKLIGGSEFRCDGPEWK